MTTSTATRIPAPDDYRWLPPLERFLVGQVIDPDGTPEPLHTALVELNTRARKARELRTAFEAMTEAAFLEAIAADRDTDAHAASTGTLTGPPANTAGTFLEERMRLHRDAGTWTTAANTAGHDVLRVVTEHRDTLARDAAPQITPPLAAAAKTARAALEKTRPVLASIDYRDAFAAWMRSLDSLNALNSHTKPAPGVQGAEQDKLDAVLTALDAVTT